jgi:hypothetical protein
MTTMKIVTIKVAGSEREPIERGVLPGATAGELLADMGLGGTHALWLPACQGMTLGEDEELWSQVEDGDMLYALLTTYTLF